MNHATQIKLSERPAGRMVLHLLALRRDGLWRWHWRAICREFMARRDKPDSSTMLSAVTLALDAPEAKDVWLAGEFNGWLPNTMPLMREEDGVWRTTIRLPPGRYQYKFVADGQQLHDPNARENVTNEYGSSNSVIEV